MTSRRARRRATGAPRRTLACPAAASAPAAALPAAAAAIPGGGRLQTLRHPSCPLAATLAASKPPQRPAAAAHPSCHPSCYPSCYPSCRRSRPRALRPSAGAALAHLRFAAGGAVQPRLARAPYDRAVALGAPLRGSRRSPRRTACGARSPGSASTSACPGAAWRARAARVAARVRLFTARGAESS